MTDVCLVLMPYAAVERPSLALGLLKSALETHGISATAIYPNLWFAEMIGLPKYEVIGKSRPELLMGEWTFAQAAFPESQLDRQTYLDRIAYDHQQLKQVLDWVRQQASDWIDTVVESVRAIAPRIVACSSTFQQHCASLALLRRLKTLDPQIITVMGGANCEASMGQATHQAFTWVDYVCSGEGDETLVQLCRQLLKHGKSAQNLPYGTIANGSIQTAPRASVADLDKVAIPNYDEYFQTLRQLKISDYIHPGIPIETSRGCWWGQKQHCSFCGLNGTGMTYRAKSPQRVVEEFTLLGDRYGLDKFFVVDNILALQHINTVMPMLTALSRPYTIFYETKANLKKSQLQQLAQAGVRFIQPGIEHMHDRALELLHKGNVALMNVQLLKWCRELGILVDWNFLLGIPGESDTWYREIMEWLPLIFHLQPPSATYPIRYDRFSPYHDHQQEYGLRLAPHQAYSYVYPISQELIEALAYYFEEQSENKSNQTQQGYRAAHWRETGLNPAHQALQELIDRWGKQFWSFYPPRLTYKLVEQTLIVKDTRPHAVKAEIHLTGLAAKVYQACDRLLSRHELIALLDRQSSEIDSVIKQLKQQRLLLDQGGKMLSLAVREPFTPLPNSENYPGGHINIKQYLRDRRTSVQVCS